MDQYQEFIHRSRYARWIPELNRRESWSETVQRYVNFWLEREQITAAEGKKIYNAIYNLEVMPSMRCLMTAGPALAKDNAAGFNCAYAQIDSPRSLDELMYILMCGTGKGFSVERNFINELPIVAESFHTTDSVIVVSDSKSGWASAFRELIALLYAGKIPQWDVSRVRPSGARLKTFGGRASGPEPLVDLFNFCVGIFPKAKGRKLTSIECHDICCKIADIVVVGGVRRSALISLSNLSDQRMSKAKSGDWWRNEGHRRLANNSVAYTEKPDFQSYLAEMQNLYESKAGERGIFSRVAAQKIAAKNGRRDADQDFGTNPCLHPDSLVQTIHGVVRIADITEPTKVYTMQADGSLGIRDCSASWVSKKNAATLNITIASGKVVRCTPDHKIFIEGKGWIEAKDIQIKDRVVHLVRSRRGAAYSGVKLTTQGPRDYIMEHRLVWASEYGPIPEYHDIHHIDGDTYNNDIDNLECLSHSDHARLTALEQPNNHAVCGLRDHSPGRHGSLQGFVSPANSKHGAKTIIPMPEELKAGLHQVASVVAISEGETTDVYDLTVEDTHNFIADFVVVHNCSEIILRSNQFCNLSEVVVRADDTVKTLKKKVEMAAIIGTLQATLTDFRYLRKVWKKNTEEEALLGVSLTGIMDNKLLNNCTDKLNETLESLKSVAVVTNKKWASKLGINQSVAITCVKPSGTVSQLVNSASGIHPRFSNYYIRRVRSDKKDPLAVFMQEAGFAAETDVTSKETLVFGFPIKSPEGSVTVKQVGAMEQLKLWKAYQDHWCEHKPSITVYYTDDEFLQVTQWIWENFDSVSGISLLPVSDHVYQQAPYEDISAEEYERLVAEMPSGIDWNDLQNFETEDNTTGSQELACVGGTCEIV